MFVHIDIDSFFASAERSIDPGLKNIPMAVGGRSNLEIFNKKRTNIRLINNNSGAFVTPVFYSDRAKSFDSYFVDRTDGSKKIRGIVTTASYEARECGVKTAMPIAHALRICPKLIVVPSHYPLYHRLSHRIHRFLQQRIPLLEQYSIDEFFGDLDGWIADKDAIHFARKLQQELFDLFEIPVSIGISRSKWIAKVATGFAKPFGVYEVENIDKFIKNIPIKAFPGIGKGFQKRLENYGIARLGEIRERKTLFYSWKKPGIELYHRVTGTDNEPISMKTNRKSIGISRTFDPLRDTDEIKRRIMIMARHIVYIVMTLEANPTTYYLKINYQYALKAKQSKTVDRLFSEALFKSELAKMYESIAYPKAAALKISVNVSNFTGNHTKTLSLLHIENDQKQFQLTQQLQYIRTRFGLDIVKHGSEL